jgi:hypothetical protein
MLSRILLRDLYKKQESWSAIQILIGQFNIYRNVNSRGHDDDGTND